MHPHHMLTAVVAGGVPRGAGYQYTCPMPGHAQMGMHGSFTVR
jgi:hypothetical protein